MAFQAELSLLIICLIPPNVALLFNGNNNPEQTTTLGPLETDATLSKLVKYLLDLEARVQSQEQEIKSLKIQEASKENVTTVSMNKLISQYIDLKLSYGMIKQKLDQNNNHTRLQTLETIQKNMAQSIRYLTMSLQENEVHDKETNITFHHELDRLNMTFINEMQNMYSEIQNYTGSKERIYQYESELASAVDNIRSEIELMMRQRSFIEYALDIFYKFRKIRLVGGDFMSGTVEVMHNGTWGTVCDDHFDDNAAKVVCRMIGLPTENALAYSDAHFGQGTGHIVFDDVVCIGNETKLQNCRHTALGHTDCSHGEDVGVKCG